MRGVAREEGKSPAFRAFCASSNYRLAWAMRSRACRLSAPPAQRSPTRRVPHRAKGGAARFRAAPPFAQSGRAGLTARRATDYYCGLISRQVPGTCLQVSENCRPRLMMQLS